jgi:hypothetical protein
MNLLWFSDMSALPRRNKLPLLAVCVALLRLVAANRADISGNYTLGANETFSSSISADPFTIGSSKSTWDLQGFTTTLTGPGDFEVASSIAGSGNLVIDLASSSAQVQFDSGNTFNGLTTVRGGTLLLSTPSEENNGIVGDLYIGGGPNLAKVTREDKHNRELISDTSSITIAQNGTLQFDRMNTGNSPVHDSTESLGKVIMNGGTLLNASVNDRLTTLNIGTVTLLSSSVWDLGKAMTMNIGDVNSNIWTSGATLTIKNWSSDEPIYIHNISSSQLAQIRFETPGGLMGAQQLADTQIVPMAIVPEASTLLLIPLLFATAIFPLIRELWQKRGQKTNPA